ncbi:hypothetical protein EDD16DRAFT_1726420 [Pisolithus croceorrhizus]|nr:hypothetical protein EV401DRAFT_2199643 [Pisolithus croceorrhizus]KAI6119774.1 hypothetical protein EDD16DRAFT_1726420 [Pisolithus croceorrhizus]
MPLSMTTPPPPADQGPPHVTVDTVPLGQPQPAPDPDEEPQVAPFNAVMPDQRDNEPQDPVPRPLCQWLTCQLPPLKEFSQSIYHSIIIGLAILVAITGKGTVNAVAEALAWMATLWLAGSGITAALTSFALACPLVGESYILRLVNIFSRYMGLLVGWFLLVGSVVAGICGGSLPISSFLVIIFLACKLVLNFNTRLVGNRPTRG